MLGRILTLRASLLKKFNALLQKPRARAKPQPTQTRRTHRYLMTFKSRAKFADLAARFSDAIPSRTRLRPFKILFRSNLSEPLFVRCASVLSRL